MKRPLRIAFISPFIFRLARGIERFTVNLAGQLAALGQSVDVLAWAGPLKPALDPRLGVRRVPAARYFQAHWAAAFYARELLRGRYDVVNLFFAGYGEAAAIRWAQRGRPFAVNFIAGYPYAESPHRFHEFVAGGLSRRLARVIVKSDFMAPEIERVLGQPTTSLPNGVDLSYFDPALVDSSAVRAQLHIAADECVLLTVAALEERKGIGSIIAALPELLRWGLPMRYLVAGEGRDRQVFERQIQELGLQDIVLLVGAQADVRPFYGLADIFLLPSRGEGLPNALLEAMAMRLPIVVSQQPPYDKIVRPEFGLCVNEGDPSSLGAALAGLTGDAARRTQMGEAARAHVCASYAWPVVAQRYLEVFRACAAA